MALAKRFTVIDASETPPIKNTSASTEQLKSPAPGTANVSQGRVESRSVNTRVSNKRVRSKRSPPPLTDLQMFVRKFLRHESSTAASALRFLILTMMSLDEVTKLRFGHIVRLGSRFVILDGNSNVNRLREVPLTTAALAEVGTQTIVAPGELVFCTKETASIRREEIRSLLHFGGFGGLSKIRREFRDFASGYLNGKEEIAAFLLGESELYKRDKELGYGGRCWFIMEGLMSAWGEHVGLEPDGQVLRFDRQRT